ncbi:MAG: trypsin-like peptidase domain-containing protein [Bacillota bacterium]
MRKLLKFYLTTIFVFCFASSVYASGAYTVTVDDKPLALSTSVTVEEQRFFVPLREVYEAIGYTVTWNPENQTIDLVKNGEVTRVKSGVALAYKSSEVIPMEYAPKVINGTTMVTIDFFLDHTRVAATLDEETKVISVVTPSISIDRMKESVVYIQTNLSQGSGVVLSSEGLIATNYHVIEGASSLQIKFNDGTVYTGRLSIVGIDVQKDIALIQLYDAPSLAPARTNMSGSVLVNAPIYTIGSPLGQQNVVSSGFVLGSTADAINVSAELEKGNSGGGLFLDNGVLIGITYGYGDNQNLAIPIDTVLSTPQTLLLSIDSLKNYTYEQKPIENFRYYVENDLACFTWSPVYKADYYYVSIAYSQEGPYQRLYNTVLQSDIWHWAYPYAFAINVDLKDDIFFLRVSAVINGEETLTSEPMLVDLSKY